MFYVVEYSFEKAPELEAVRSKCAALVGAPFQLSPHGEQDDTMVLHSGVEATGVGLTRDQHSVTLHAAVDSIDLGHAQRALEELGGTHPPDRSESLDYGESWLGIFAEDDDFIFHGESRRFRLWTPFLVGLEQLTPVLEVLVDLAEQGAGSAVTVSVASLAEELSGVLSTERDEPFADRGSVALGTLVRFLGSSECGSEILVSVT